MKTIYPAEQQVKFLQLKVDIESLLIQLQTRQQQSVEMSVVETPKEMSVAGNARR